MLDRKERIGGTVDDEKWRLQVWQHSAACSLPSFSMK